MSSISDVDVLTIRVGFFINGKYELDVSKLEKS